MSTVMDTTAVAASEPLVEMAGTGEAINDGAIKDGATNANDKVAAITDNAGAKTSSDEGSMVKDTSKTKPATPKKRGAKNDDGAGGPPKKKRATPKSKKAKEDENHEEDGEAVEGDAPETPVKKTAARGKGGKGKNNKTNGSAEPITPPKTPKVKGLKVGNDVTGAVMSDDEDGNEAEASITQGPAITKKGAARKRASAGKIGNNVPISTSLETASAEDKMLVKMKEEGKSWAVIRDAWETMTGEKTKSSTLPNRYIRLKSNFMTLKEGDGARLLAARAEVEADIEAHVAKLRAEIWSKVQKLMEDKGTTEKYPTPFLIKKHEELSAKPAISSDDDEAKDGKKEEDSEDAKDVKMEEAPGEEGGETVGAAAEEI